MSDDIFNAKTLLNSIDNSSLMLHLTGRKRDNDLYSITPTIESKVQTEIINIIEAQIFYYDNQRLKSYNIVGSSDETVEVTEFENFKDELDEIISSLKVPNACSNIDPNDYDFFVYELRNKKGKDPVYIFRRLNKMKALKKGIIGQIINGAFSSLESSKFLGIDNALDFIVINKKIFVFHHISLERILKLKDKFKEKAKEVLNNDEFPDKIKNFNKLKEKALENGNYVKRLAKLHDNGKVTAFLDQIDRTKSVIDQFDLDLEVENGKLVYRDETQVGNFINLMQDSYYRTLIGKQNGIDENR